MIKPKIDKTETVEVKIPEVKIPEVKIPEVKPKEILPGDKVHLIGVPNIDENIEFPVIQVLKNGKVSVLGKEGLILYVEPKNIK